MITRQVVMARYLCHHSVLAMSGMVFSAPWARKPSPTVIGEVSAATMVQNLAAFVAKVSFMLRPYSSASRAVIIRAIGKWTHIG